MKDEDCAKILIDSAFKEANLFWIRNSAITVIQTLLFGFYISLISEQNVELSETNNTVICSLGILLSIIHFVILILSQRFNMAWMGAYKDFVESRLTEDNQSNYTFLNSAIKKMPGRKFSFFSTTTFFMLIPIALAIFWIYQV